LRPEQERILVIPRAKLGTTTVGFLSVGEASAQAILRTIREKGKFVRRKAAEADPGYVQPIALAYIEHDDAILVLRRDDQDHSAALRGRDVLWVGGHIERVDRRNLADSAGRRSDPIAHGLRREISEELPKLPPDVEPELVGLVTDDTNDRSRMHLGLVHRLRIDDQLVAREIAGDAERPAFLPVAQMLTDPGLLEPWSLSILTEHVARARATVSSGAGSPT